MTETNTLEALEPDETREPRDFALALLQNGPTQVGGMVTSVILVGQAFSQFSQAIAPFVAFLFSCLLAIYQVWLVQKATARQCLIIVPIAALILFALSLGSNNSIAPAPDNSILNRELTSIKEQLQLRDKELESARQLINELQHILRLPVNSPLSQEKNSDGSSSKLIRFNRTQDTKWFLGSLIGEAHAQPSDSETERQKALEALRAYQARQQKLEQEQQKLQREQQKLRAEQERLPKAQGMGSQPATLWRKW